MAESKKRPLPRPIRSVLQLLHRHRPLRDSDYLRDRLSTPTESGNGYLYQPLPTPTSIRVLKLSPLRKGRPRRAKLIVVDLDDDPEYDCLSYVWGDRKDPRTCVCDDWTVSITQSLAGFLDVYQTDGTSKPIWVDSVCVDQSNLDELTQQVAQMGRVYSQAECVHVWLGSSDSSLDYEKVMHGISLLTLPGLYRKGEASEGYWRSFLEQVAGCERLSDALRAYWRVFIMRKSRPAHDEDQLVLCMTKFAELLQHPWFTRAWTYQESMLAKERQFHFGDQTCGDTDMNAAVVLLLRISIMAEPSKQEIGKALNEDDDNVNLSCLRADQMLGSFQAGDKAYSLIQLLETRRGAVCQREQDIVFSLLGLAQDHDGVIVDYTKPLSQLFYEIARRDLEDSGRLDVLTYRVRSQERRHQIADQGLDVPYWVPDWGIQRAGYLQETLFHAPSYDCNRSKLTSVSFLTDGRRLHVDGMFLGRIMYTVNLTELGSTLTDISQNALSHLRRSSSTILDTDTRTILRTYLADEQLDSDNRWDSSTYEEMQSKLETNDADLFIWLHAIRGYLALFTTNNGLLGRASKTAQVGDVIAILWGHRVPFVLRKTPHDTYRVIGECYVDEMMDGQAIKEEGDPGYEEYLQSLTTFVFD